MWRGVHGSNKSGFRGVVGTKTDGSGYRQKGTRGIGHRQIVKGLSGKWGREMDGRRRR